MTRMVTTMFMEAAGRKIEMCCKALVFSVIGTFASVPAHRYRRHHARR